jgi:propanediol dehydratase large subunit
MMDKMKRIGSFVENGELMVKDESVLDTLQDLANYSCLMAGYILSEKRKKAKSGIEPSPSI